MLGPDQTRKQVISSRVKDEILAKKQDGSDISCKSQCKQTFSTREAMRLHTCNSILDRMHLTDDHAAARSRHSSSESAKLTAN